MRVGSKVNYLCSWSSKDTKSILTLRTLFQVRLINVQGFKANITTFMILFQGSNIYHQGYEVDIDFKDFVPGQSHLSPRIQGQY